MGKIVILETTDILGMKMKKILMQNGFENVELIKKFGMYNPKKTTLFQDMEFVIADLDNPYVDAAKLISELKSQKDSSNIPAIFMSGSADLKKLKRAIAAGGTDFILKPFETETLINKIYKIYGKTSDTSKSENKFKTGELFDECSITVEWSEEFEIGVPDVDAEHKEIVERFNGFCCLIKEKDNSKYQGMLDFMYDYVNIHFQHEEKLQLEVGYSNYEEHKKIHDDFKIKVMETVDKYRGKEITDDEIISISLFIKDWLLEHILVEDQKIKDFAGGRKNDSGIGTN